MPSERFVEALNEQIANEFAAGHQYVAVGVHYEAETFPRLAQFCYEQAEEEREHEMKMVRYLLAVAERTREIPMLLEEYLARDKPGQRSGS